MEGWYGGQCQVCGNVLVVPSGTATDYGHIKPLGSPHTGDDSTNNMLSLCPNHHRQFDRGAISIDPDALTILAPRASFPVPLPRLLIHTNHQLDREAIRYHRATLFRP